MTAHLDRFHANVRALCTLALARLPRMIDPATGLFNFGVSGEELTPRGTSVRYTAMTAIGLERAEAHGLGSPVDLDHLYEALGATLAGVDNLGDLGLVIWAAARRARPLAERALKLASEFPDHVQRRRGMSVHSTELALFTNGLTEALAAGVGSERDVRSRLDKAFRCLSAQRGPSGLLPFSRPAPGRETPPTVHERLQSELGFFDAQIYSLLAALRRHEILEDADAKAMARTIAEHLLAGQHPLGQWAWHYNVRSGAVVDLYPVYAVHQDGMAPMALLPAERLLGLSTVPAIARGVKWLFGRNELETSLVDTRPDRALIWRSIRRKSPLRSVVYPLKLASLLDVGRGLDLGARLASPDTLEIDREMRPYHLGFCLYAFSALAGSLPAEGELPPDSEPRPTLKTGNQVEPESRARASNST
jgi:hypothetical protein